MKTMTILNLKSCYTFVSLASNTFKALFSYNLVETTVNRSSKKSVFPYLDLNGSVKLHHEVDIFSIGVNFTVLGKYF